MLCTKMSTVTKLLFVVVAVGSVVVYRHFVSECTAPSYKLTYFDGRGKAEIDRLVFAAAGVKFEDVRLNKDDFIKLKRSLPFGQVPILEIDGVMYCQSLSIARYLANEFGLAGKSSVDKFRVDMITECLLDVRNPISTFSREADPVKKEEMKQRYIKDELPAFLDKLEAILKQNNGGGSFFVGDSVTLADLQLVAVHESWQLNAGLQSPLSNHSRLESLYKRILALPKIADYISKRPSSTF